VTAGRQIYSSHAHVRAAPDASGVTRSRGCNRPHGSG